MRTITLGIAIYTLFLLVLEAVEAKSYFYPRNLAFQPRSRYCLVAQDCPTTLPAAEVLRGGAAKKTTEEDEEIDSDEECDDEDSDSELDMEEEDEDEEVEEDEYDADEYDDEYDEEEGEEETSVTVADKGEIVEPYFVPPQLQLYVMFGSIMMSRKLDLFNPVVVKVIRFLFVLQLVLHQIFIFYVRIMAKKNNDRTPIQQKNPLSEILQKQMDQTPGGNDMVKNLASSFLSSETTVMEYDLRQASNMQGGIIFNMLFNWFLHFKLQKTQPLLMQIISGTLQLAYHPLFQVYVLRRNLERPFKSQMTAAQKMMEAKAEAEKGDTAEEAKANDEEEVEDDDDSEEVDDGDGDDADEDIDEEDEDIDEDDEDTEPEEDDSDDEDDEDSDGSS